MTQLYVILSSTQDENKGEIKKTQEEIKKTQKEINEEIYETQKDFNWKFGDILDMFKRRGGITILMWASHEGVLKKDEYQFSYPSYHIRDRLHQLDTPDGWYKLPYNGKIEQLVLKTPHNYKSHYHDHITKSDDYTTTIRPFLQIQVRTDRSHISVAKTYMCNLFYVKKIRKTWTPYWMK